MRTTAVLLGVLPLVFLFVGLTDDLPFSHPVRSFIGFGGGFLIGTLAVHSIIAWMETDGDLPD